MGQTITEKKWTQVPKVALIGNGDKTGIVNVPDSSNYYVNQVVSLSTDGTNDNATNYQVDQVWGPTVIYVRLVNQAFGSRADTSAYTVAGGATITAAKQTRPNIVSDEVIRAVFAEEPAVAFRVLNVDTQGNKIGSVYDPLLGVNGGYRLAVDAAVTVSGITVNVDALNPPTQPTPNSILLAGTTTGTQGGLKVPIRATLDGNLQVITENSLITVPYDAIGVNRPTGFVDVFSYYQGGLAGTLVATVTNTYSDLAHQLLISAVRT